MVAHPAMRRHFDGVVSCGVSFLFQTSLAHTVDVVDGFPKQETRWLCSDGLHFADESRANRHQKHIDRIAQANDVLNAGGSVLGALRVAGYTLCDHEYVEVLSRVSAGDRLPNGTMSYLIPLQIVSGFGVLCLRNEPTSTSTVELTPRDLATRIREEKA